MAPIYFAFAVFALSIFIRIFSGTRRDAIGGEASLDIKAVSGKAALRLSVNVPLRMTLELRRANAFSRALRNTWLFPQPTSGDEEFDEIFSMTAYRNDVIDLVRRDAGLRNAFISWSKGGPSFWSFRINNGRLVTSLGGARLKGEALDSARDNLAALVQVLIGSFASLPPDSPAEVFAHKRDISSTILLAILLVALLAVAPIYDHPFATRLPYGYVALGVGTFFAVQMALLLSITTRGYYRIRAVIFTLFASLISSFAVMPGLIYGINALSHQKMLKEVVAVQALYETPAKKSSSHYYIVLTRIPTNIACSIVDGLPRLEVTDSIFTHLESQPVQYGSKLEVEEAVGALGLPIIVQVIPQ